MNSELYMTVQAKPTNFGCWMGDSWLNDACGIKSSVRLCYQLCEDKMMNGIKGLGLFLVGQERTRIQGVRRPCHEVIMCRLRFTWTD